jgi:hypothetical protein
MLIAAWGAFEAIILQMYAHSTYLPYIQRFAKSYSSIYTTFCLKFEIYSQNTYFRQLNPSKVYIFGFFCLLLRTLSTLLLDL